ncbi:MAG: DHHA2 domain-containing protein [Butyricicoccus sp.]
MFRSSSRLLDRSMDELFHMDFKYFQAQNQKIAISQVTSVSENELSGIRDKMLEYMESCLASSGLSMLFAMLTNIIEEKTELLYVGKGAQQLVRAAFKTDCGEHSVVLPGVVSRKKQMVAPLVRAMEHDEEIG